MEDCLICFNPVPYAWAPPLSCDCRQVVHRACWYKWIDNAGPTCLICRKAPEHEEDIDPEPEVELHIIVLEPPPRGRRNCRDFVWWLLLFYFVSRIISNWVISKQPQQQQQQQQPRRIHDEL